MKIYIGKNHILLSGKVWEIRRNLKNYCNHYQYVHEWINEGLSKK